MPQCFQKVSAALCFKVLLQVEKAYDNSTADDFEHILSENRKSL